MNTQREHLDLLVREAPRARLATFPGKISGISKDDIDTLMDRVLEFVHELPHAE